MKSCTASFSRARTPLRNRRPIHRRFLSRPRTSELGTFRPCRPRSSNRPGLCRASHSRTGRSFHSRYRSPRRPFCRCCSSGAGTRHFRNCLRRAVAAPARATARPAREKAAALPHGGIHTANLDRSPMSREHFCLIARNAFASLSHRLLRNERSLGALSAF
jgi:hypothetical protein